MSGLQTKMACLAIMGIAAMLPNFALAQSQTTATQSDQPNRVSIAYGQPNNSAFQQLYGLLRERRALERIQEILSPLRAPEQLTIKTTECGAVNSYYQRENFKPTVTICYELLKNILDSLPNETTPAGVTPDDAAVGQFFFTTLHEVGHAAFDIFGVPIFGHEEDAADNFATYIMLQFGRAQARRLIGGAAWAWRADQFRGPWRRRYHGTRVGPEPHAEHKHVPGLGIAPGAELVAPCRIVLRSAQTFRLIGGKGGRDRAITPGQPALAGLVSGRS